MELTKHSLIKEVLATHPETRPVFLALGLGCPDCLGAGLETVETGARMHGLDADAVLAALEEAITARRPGGETESQQE